MAAGFALPMNGEVRTSSDLVVVGLGNPGPEYEHTRHNIGWRCVEAFGERVGVALTRRRWRSRVGSGFAGGRRVWLLEPQTFMNMSGRAVKEALRDLQVPLDSLWVVHDEMDLPLCRLRIRVGGSDAGHNGIGSIVAALGADEFVRFRVGVGKQPAPGSAVGARHVLGRFARVEADAVDAVVRGVACALETALQEGFSRAMEVYNRSGSLGCEEIA
jgi:PTH1 family peptidyl-tRNA hydrolase